MELSEIHSALAAHKQGRKSVFLELLKSTLRNCWTPEFSQGEDRPCQESDFESFKPRNEKNLQYLRLILEDLIKCDYFKDNWKQNRNIVNESHSGVDEELLAIILIVVGENISLNQWNNENTVNGAVQTLKLILGLYNCKGLPEILVTESQTKSLFKDLLLNLRPRLLPNTWKHYPASIACYIWIIKNVKQPNLSPFLHLVLPTALLLVDDYVIENQIIGVDCLDHVITNVTITELKYYGHGDVMYNALESLLRTREPELLQVSLPCIISLVSKLETNIGGTVEVKWSKFDQVLEIYLENMELEHSIALREIYIKNLENIIKCCNCKIIRWSRKLLKIFREYLEVAGNHYEMETMNYCLKALEKYIVWSQLVFALYSDIILLMLFKTLYCLVNMADDAAQKANVELAVKCTRKILDNLSMEGKRKLKSELTQKMGKNVHCKFFNFLITLIDG